jgi:XTP/dITP diphosphohydrolase
MTMRLVLASNNAKKLRELNELLGGLALELVAQGSLGIDEAEEPHHTFIENGLAKARHAARAAGGAVLADDSGLCVPALGGEPGVRSAVYAGPLDDSARGSDREARRRLQDAANNELLLRRLASHADETSRAAYFVSVLVAVRHADDPEPLVAVGRWHGSVLASARGEGGFGYDPLLFIPALGATVAELAPDVKNRHSHRAQAAGALRELLASVWRL